MIGDKSTEEASVNSDELLAGLLLLSESCPELDEDEEADDVCRIFRKVEMSGAL